MALSSKDKIRIEEEEAYRVEVRENLKNPPKKKKGISCFGAIAILFILAVIVTIPGALVKSTPNKTLHRENFRASVNFTGTQFVISNNDDLDCENARLEVNGSYNLNGYTLKMGEKYTVGALQFSKDDGTRLNPFQVKPKTFSIYCSQIGASNDLGGAGWYGEFN